MTREGRTTELRVGSIPYLVGRPLDLGLEHEPGIALERAVPAELARRLRAGELDVALVSSIELFRQSGSRFIGGLGVAGAGSIVSVQVFLRREIEQLTSLALDPASRAAAALVRVLFERRLGGEARGLPRGTVRFHEVPPGADPRAEPCDAWLRIGDTALKERLGEGLERVFCPSAQWHARTGLPFVFAVWLVRAGVDLEPAQLAAFARARARGRAAVERLALGAAREWNLPEAACLRYLREECLFEPGAQLEPALQRFRDEAAALDLCPPGRLPGALLREHVA